MSQFDDIVKTTVNKYGRDKTPEDREDYFQECQLTILKEQDTIRRLESPHRERYVAIICKNTILQIFRKTHNDDSISDLGFKEPIEEEPDLDVKIDADNAVHKLDDLPDPYRGVLEMRFGLADGEEKTFQEIGEFFGKTRQWAQQIEKKGLEMLRDKYANK